jgi:hypothetical protein
VTSSPEQTSVEEPTAEEISLREAVAAESREREIRRLKAEQIPAFVIEPSRRRHP